MFKRKFLLFLSICLAVAFLMAFAPSTAYAQCEGDYCLPPEPETDIKVVCRRVSYSSDEAWLADYSIITNDGVNDMWTGFVPIYPPVFEWEKEFPNPVTYGDFWILPPTQEALEWWEEHKNNWPGFGEMGTVAYVDEYIECKEVKREPLVDFHVYYSPSGFFGEGEGAERTNTCQLMTHPGLGAEAVSTDRISYWCEQTPEDMRHVCGAGLYDDGEGGITECDSFLSMVGERRASLRDDPEDMDLLPKIERYKSQVEELAEDGKVELH